MKIIKWKYMWMDAITLAPFCILIKPKYFTDEVTINHEKIHWQQQKELKYIGFYLLYIIEWMFKGYRNISFEVEAYEWEWFLRYLDQRPKYGIKEE